jgi:hypothetical protein
MSDDYEQKAREFIAAARLYRSWDEDRLEAELQRLAEQRGERLEVVELDRGVWRAAFMTSEDDPDFGPATTLASEGGTGGRKGTMENLLLLATGKL